MNDPISKTDFKAHALAVLRDIEQTGESRVITDRGKPTLEIRKLRRAEKAPLEMLSGSVVAYDGPTDPVADDEWDTTS